MLTLMIADDEPMIVKGIQKLIDWQGLGMTIIGTYNDGTSALAAIIAKRPDMAILDISMPGKTGIEIIKEVRALGLHTKIIFISGFQEFVYVKEAIKYDALEYLLKPIKKDDLLRTIEKSLTVAPHQIMTQERDIHTDHQTPLPASVMNQLASEEVDHYHLVLLDFLLEQASSASERRLKLFSMAALVEEIVGEEPGRILFTKDQRSVVIVSNHKLAEVKAKVIEIIRRIKERGNYTIGAVISEAIENMGDIPVAYEYCVSRIDDLFFLDMMAVPVIVAGEATFMQHYSNEDLETYKIRTIEAIFSAGSDSWKEEFSQYAKIVGVLASGQKENAWFYLNSLIKEVGQRFAKMNIKLDDFDMTNALAMGKESASYDSMKAHYFVFLERYKEIIKKAVETNEYSDILKVKAYVEKHYPENVTLEILANLIHMNAYYFSSYFKKHTGENFKDYVNRVRMNAAMELLLTTSMKSYEIAEEVGFKDHKYFSKIFQKRYGMTPSQYKRSLN